MPNIFRIYQLSEQLEHLLDALEEHPDAAPESLQAGIDALTGEFNARVEDVALAIQNAKARCTSIYEEIARLQTIVNREEATQVNLKNALLVLMNKAQVQKVKGTLVTVSVAKNGGAVPIELTVDPKDLPEKYRTEKVEYSLNRSAVEQDEKLGFPLPDCIKLKERGQHVRIS